MGSWENGPGMIQAPELEEGEACYYKDDRSMNPDIALSYIGDRVQSLLGHFQKDFEGGVSAENLGAKFGGYGSFLPMHQRFPLVLSQPKFSHGVQNSSGPRFPNNSPQEGPAPNFTQLIDAPSTLRNDFSSASPSIYPSKNIEASSKDLSIKENTFVSSYNVAEAFPGKAELPPNKSENPTEQRTLKVRLKFGSEMVSQYNAEIHSLGLTSPSSSTENCPEESARFEYGETAYVSPANILQIMTSFLVSGDSLLSPICEDFLSLSRDTESSARSEYKANPKSSTISLGIEKKNILKGKKAKSADKSENFEKSEAECIPDLNDLKKKTSGSETLGCRLQPLNGLTSKPLSDAVCSISEPLKEAVRPPDVVRGSEKDVPLKKRKGSKDRLNGRSVSSNLVENASVGCTPTQSYGKYDQQESRCSDGHKFGEDLTRVSQNDVSVNYGHDSNKVKSYSDISDGESVKVAKNKFSLKFSKSGEQDNLGLPLDVNNLSLDKKPKASQNSAKLASKSADILMYGGCAAPKDMDSGKKENGARLTQKDVLDRRIEHMDYPKGLLGRPSGNKSKNSNLDSAKKETGYTYTDKFKGRSSNKKCTDKITSETHVIEPPAKVIPSNQGIIAGTQETMVDPVIIQEDWVGCDRCEKWRLLPYGTKSNQLPEKWVCSMLDWLPGMNSCEVSEDETTNAVRASLSVPIPENHYNAQAHADRSIFGVTSVGAHHFTPSHKNFTSDKVAYQAKRQKLKESSNAASMSNPVPSINVQTNFQRHSMNSTNLKEVNQPHAGAEAMKECESQHPKKSAISKCKSNKRKDENMVGDLKSRKRIKKESFQDEQGTAKKIKSKRALNVDNFQVSGGNLDWLDHNLNSGFPSKESMKEEKKLSVRKDSSYRERGNLQIHVKKQKDQMQDLPDGELYDINASNQNEVSAKKRKFKDCDGREHREEAQQSIKEEDEDIDFQREQKSTVSQIYDEFKRSKGGDLSKRKVAKARVILSRSSEKSTSSGVKGKLQSKNLKVKLPLTKEDIDELRKDLGCAEFPMAVTSSSSKISDSRKNRVGFMEVKGSPEESVSSSPMRMPYLNQVLPVTLESGGKVDSREKELSAIGSGKKSLGVNRNSELGIMKKGKATGVCHVESFKNTAGFRESAATEITCGEREFLGTSLVDDQSSILEQSTKEGMSMDLSTAFLPQQNSGKSFAWQSTIKKRTHGEKFAEKVSDPSTGSEILDLKEKLKEEADVDDNYHALQSEVLSNVKHSFSDESSIKSIHHGRSAALETNFANENVSNLPLSTALKEAQDALKKAEELKSHANLIKNSGFGSESNYEYLKAALKFLHGASLLEANNDESIKKLENNRIQIYGTAANLCETCAYEYEQSCELAAAALAYKCEEVAYMKIVYCKSSNAHRIWRDLQANLQMLPQGESPSSSASDVDNLNNLAVADRAPSSKGNDSHASNHVMVPRNRANLARLLDYTKDVNSAMEAAKKSLDTWKAAQIKLEESQNKEAIASVKRVIDSGFHDVEELINSVWLAFNAINRQAPSRTRE